MITITCMDCFEEVRTKSIRRMRCDDCAESEKQRRSKNYNIKHHKCATCEASISEHKTYCGSATKKGTCMYEHAKRLACESRKKPKLEKTHKLQVRNHYNDPACGSGFF